MPTYYVEGLYANAQGVKKKHKTGVYPSSSIEPFARSVWANDPKEAIRLATEELNGGEWVKAPKVSQVSEEQRMRNMGMPELPGFSVPPAKVKPTGKNKPK